MRCLFCNITSGDIKTDIIFENEYVVAFRDIHPQAPQHILIIPRQHIATLNDLNTENSHLPGEMMLAAKTLAADLGFAEAGYRTLMNCNADGGQTVFHIHLHLLAGRPMRWPPG